MSGAVIYCEKMRCATLIDIRQSNINRGDLGVNKFHTIYLHEEPLPEKRS